MSDFFEIKAIKEIDPAFLNKGRYLVVLNFDKVPPHIVLLENGRYYDLHLKGNHIAIDFESTLTLIQSKKIKTLFFELNSVSKISNEQVLTKIFSVYPKINIGNNTCLSPIKKALSALYNIALNSEIIFDLLSELNKNGLVNSVFHLNADSLIDNDLLKWRKYDREQLLEKISGLSKHKANA